MLPDSEFTSNSLFRLSFYQLALSIVSLSLSPTGPTPCLRGFQTMHPLCLKYSPRRQEAPSGCLPLPLVYVFLLAYLCVPSLSCYFPLLFRKPSLSQGGLLTLTSPVFAILSAARRYRCGLTPASEYARFRFYLQHSVFCRCFYLLAFCLPRPFSLYSARLPVCPQLVLLLPSPR